MNKKPDTKAIQALIKTGEYKEAASLLLMACEPGDRIAGPAAIHQALLPWAGKAQEHFLVITLAGDNSIINIHVMSKGLVNRTIVHPREVYRFAIQDNSCAVIVAHNHPSGKLEASDEDKAITERLAKAGKIIGIELLDALIVSPTGYSSAIETDPSLFRGGNE